MPEIQAAGGAVWGAAAAVQAVGGAAWADGTSLQSIGSPYTPPPPPGGATVVTPGSLAPLTEILPAATYTSDAAVVVRDLRVEGAEGIITAISGSISIEDGSALWRLSCEVPRAAYDAMRAGEQPPLVGVHLAGRQWAFVVDEMSAPRAFASTNVSLRGVSLAALADAPYELSRQWTSDAPTAAAQIASLAQTFTGLDVSWQLPDWAVPTGAWSYTGTPWGVVLQVASAVQAVVQADEATMAVTVTSRYPVMPNQWASTPPDAQIPWQAVESENVTASDKPPYTGVYVTGPAETIAAVRLAGTSGAEQAPLMSGDLLTDLPGQVELGRTVLAQSGRAETVTRTLQVLTGAGEPGVIDRGKLVRWVDPEATWTGMVRALSIRWEFGQVRQTVACERRMSFPVGTSQLPPPQVPVISFVAAWQSSVIWQDVLVPEHEPGDLLVLIQTRDVAVPGEIAGWTTASAESVDFGLRYRLSYLKDVAGTVSVLAASQLSRVFVYRGASSVQNATKGPETLGPSTTPVPDVSSNAPGGWVLALLHANQLLTAVTPPSGMTSRASIGSGEAQSWMVADSNGPAASLSGAAFGTTAPAHYAYAISATIRP